MIHWFHVCTEYKTEGRFMWKIYINALLKISGFVWTGLFTIVSIYKYDQNHFVFFFFFIFDKFRSLNLQEKAKFWRNKKDKMKWIPLVAKTSHLVNSQLGPVAPVYSELLHYSDWEGDPWYRFNKQNNNSARASHVFANFYSPSLRYMEDISTQRQIYFSLFTLWCQCSLKIHFHRKITYIWST